jgi:hypothetical protein
MFIRFRCANLARVVSCRAFASLRLGPGLGEVKIGSWLCENAVTAGSVPLRWGFGRHSTEKVHGGGGGYALIAAMSGWTPMMFMTRVRL